jgi:hypothetical protein
MCLNVLSGIGFGDTHFQVLSSFDISRINHQSILRIDERVFMTEYVFVTTVEKVNLFCKKKVILLFVTISVI